MVVASVVWRQVVSAAGVPPAVLRLTQSALPGDGHVTGLHHPCG